MATVHETIYAEFDENLSLYQILEVQPQATSSQIKKAYFKLALKYHPDKNPGDDSAKSKFQALSQVHAVLSDGEKRKYYDDSGEIPGDEAFTEDFKKWEDYWRCMFPKVTIEDIESFKEKYQGSDEEKRDVIAAYSQYNGKMQNVIDSVMLANEDDVERFEDIIKEHIEAGNIENLPGLENQQKSRKKKRKKSKKAQQEAHEAEAELAKLILGRGGGGEGGQLARRQEAFGDMMANLEAKYANPGKKGAKKHSKKHKSKKAAPHNDIDDAEFEALQQKMFGKGR